jgi:hypothetical protein
VQQSARAVRRLDRVRIISWDESWLMEAIVSHASSTGVELADPRIIKLPPRRERLPEDDKFRVCWGGVGYFLERKADKLRVSAIVQTLQEATRELSQKYSRAADTR